jgi:hypothetical protein
LKFTLTSDVYQHIMDSVGRLSAETGGVLGGRRTELLATAFHFERSSRNTAIAYTPNYSELNRLFAEGWNPKGVFLIGFAHSHPPTYPRPSRGDFEYASRILDKIPDLGCLFLPIIISAADAPVPKLLPFAVVRAIGCYRVVVPELQIEGRLGRTGPARGYVDSAISIQSSAEDRIGNTSDQSGRDRHGHSLRIVAKGRGGASRIITEVAPYISSFLVIQTKGGAGHGACDHIISEIKGCIGIAKVVVVEHGEPCTDDTVVAYVETWLSGRFHQPSDQAGAVRDRLTTPLDVCVIATSSSALVEHWILVRT